MVEVPHLSTALLHHLPFIGGIFLECVLVNVIDILEFVEVNLVCYLRTLTTKQGKNGSLFGQSSSKKCRFCFGIKALISRALRAAKARKYAERTLLHVSVSNVDSVAMAGFGYMWLTLSVASDKNCKNLKIFEQVDDIIS